MQIGLVPLPENPWNPYKFIMKTAQYLALGIVPVGTPMASNPEVIEHGVTGFLASTDEEWIEYLTLLARDHDLRNEMSRKGAIEARKKYDLESNRSKIIAAFRAAMN
jgi:glycosyltransferase involved in cell wall biosynthesis